MATAHLQGNDLACESRVWAAGSPWAPRSGPTKCSGSASVRRVLFSDKTTQAIRRQARLGVSMEMIGRGGFLGSAEGWCFETKRERLQPVAPWDAATLGKPMVAI
jgi:hypothetical protein